MPFFFDPTFLFCAIPMLILGFVAQWFVKRRFNEYSQVQISRGLTGAQIAREILETNGIYDVTVEETEGFLSDHYDPSSKALRLSPDVYHSPSVAAAGVAAHEAGHALQHNKGYVFLQFRTLMVPAVQFGSWLGPLLIMGGIFLTFLAANLGVMVAWFGVGLYTLVAIFSVLTLPVEIDASNRAKDLLYQYNIVDQRELAGVTSVLNAAAWTYVIAALAAIVEVIRWIFILSMFSRD